MPHQSGRQRALSPCPLPRWRGDGGLLVAGASPPRLPTGVDCSVGRSSRLCRHWRRSSLSLRARTILCPSSRRKAAAREMRRKKPDTDTLYPAHSQDGKDHVQHAIHESRKLKQARPLGQCVDLLRPETLATPSMCKIEYHRGTELVKSNHPAAHLRQYGFACFSLNSTMSG